MVDNWRVGDAWHDEFALEQARPDVVKLAENIVELCRQTNWEKLDSSDRPKAMLALIVGEVARIVDRVQSEDSRAIDEAIRKLRDPTESDSRRRWINRCLQSVVTNAVLLARELARSDNLHHARLSSREESLMLSIDRAAEAWKKPA